MIACKPALHHPISPFNPQDMPPARWLGPTEQGAGLFRAPCLWWQAQQPRPEGWKHKQPKLFWLPRSQGQLGEPQSPHVTGDSEFITKLLELCQKSLRWPPGRVFEGLKKKPIWLCSKGLNREDTTKPSRQRWVNQWIMGSVPENCSFDCTIWAPLACVEILE